MSEMRLLPLMRSWPVVWTKEEGVARSWPVYFCFVLRFSQLWELFSETGVWTFCVNEVFVFVAASIFFQPTRQSSCGKLQTSMSHDLGGAG